MRAFSFIIHWGILQQGIQFFFIQQRDFPSFNPDDPFLFQFMQCPCQERSCNPEKISQVGLRLWQENPILSLKGLGKNIMGYLS